MKILFFSDLHTHEYQAHAKVGPLGVNSRLEGCLTALDQIVDHANLHKSWPIFLGDLFHVKGTISVQALNGVIRRLDRLSEVSMIPGNHDMASADGRHHALECFKGFDNFEIWDEPRIEEVEDLSGENFVIASIPYPMKNGKFDPGKFAEHLIDLSEKADKYPSTLLKILISHVYTHDLMRKYVGIDGDVSASVLVKSFDMAFLGHHHIHEVITLEAGKKVVSVGSPLQLTFNDRGLKKGFVTLDTATREIKFHELEGPRFKAFEGEKSLIPEDLKGDFVRVRVTSKAEADRVEKSLKEAGAASIAIELVPAARETRIALTPGIKDTEILKKYMGSEWGTTDLDGKRLLEEGLRFLSD